MLKQQQKESSGRGLSGSGKIGGRRRRAITTITINPRSPAVRRQRSIINVLALLPPVSQGLHPNNRPRLKARIDRETPASRFRFSGQM